jgi:hypothetical protein
MFEIHELSAAPHFPEPLKAGSSAPRPENVITLLSAAPENDDIEVTIHEGEIFIALNAR